MGRSRQTTITFWNGGKGDPTFGLLRLDPTRIELTRIELTGLRHRAAGPPLLWRPEPT